MKTTSQLPWSVALLAAGLMTADAASPDLSGIMPRGGQRGKDVDFTLSGARLKDAAEILNGRAFASTIQRPLRRP